MPKARAIVHSRQKQEEKITLSAFVQEVKDLIGSSDGKDIACSLEREFLLDNDDVKKVKEKFKKAINDSNGTALVLGAGVSVDYGLPVWGDLLFDAMMRYFSANYFCKEDNIRKLIEKDLFHGNDLYELAQYLENGLCDGIKTESVKETVDNRVYELVKYALYRKKDIKYDRDDTLLKTLCRQCANGRIKRIITYNYDDTLERVFEKTDECHGKSCNSVFVDNQLPKVKQDDDNIPVYHVHGFIPAPSTDLDKTVSELLHTSEAKRLILSENSYDDMAYASYKWRNTVQIDTFLRYNCLFFGFSANDKNFKRIVKLMGRTSEYGMEQPVLHFVFMTVNDYLDNIFKLKGESNLNKVFGILEQQRPDQVIERCKFLFYMLRSKRKYLKSLGIYPIWTTKADVKNCFERALSWEF